MKISVTTKKDGFRRAGRAWTGSTILEQDELNEEQWEQLDKDPMFELVELDESESELVAKKEKDTLITQLVANIGDLEDANDTPFSQTKKPTVKSLIEITGVKNITAKMRDEAFALFIANQDSE